jgi:Fe2+ or Zn2+ uptake regulation protein
MDSLSTRLRRQGIRPTPQRVAVAEYVLNTEDHPSADRVWEEVRRNHPGVSRATVYNTLHAFVEKGLLRAQVLREGIVIFDPHVEKHHHFIDESTGDIYDIPWSAVRVSGEDALSEFNVREYQVVMRGVRKAN